MRLTKPFAALLAVLMLAAAVCGCTKHKQGQIAEIEEETVAVNVLDADGNEIGELHTSCTVTATNSGLFYARGALSNSGADTDYRIFDPKTGEDKSLGRIGKLCYEAQYARTELDGRIYVLAMTGDLMDSIDDKLWLIGFDPNGNRTETLLSEHGFPYNSMAAVNGKLLIIVHDGADTLFDKLYQYDPADGSLEEKLSFSMNGHGESLRGVYDTGEGFCLLRLVYRGGKVTNVMLDDYDYGFEQQNERDITGILREAAGQHLAKSDVDNELMQLVSRFAPAGNGWFYYENFSMTHCFIEPETGEVLSYTDLFGSSIGSGGLVYYMLTGKKPEDALAANALYGFEDGALFELSAALGDGSSDISYVSSALNGSAVAVLDSGEAGETTAYFFEHLD